MLVLSPDFGQAGPPPLYKLNDWLAQWSNVGQISKPNVPTEQEG
tara:strand:+ start:99 stop:230 length:132 start_codon:yes stop_codon:yes gene_type:complete